MSDEQEIYRDAYLRATVERGGLLIRTVRTTLAFPDVAALEASHDALLRVVRLHVGPRSRLLQDLRPAPGRNEPEFEAALTRVRSRLLPLFERRATLVQTSVGKLQLSRLQKEDKLERLVSQDEAELMRYLGFAD